MPRTKSILRYPGGKTQLAKFTNHLIKINKIQSPIYCEPFSGGSGISIELLLTNQVNSIILNDLDPSIFSIWYSILYDTDKLINTIEHTPITIDEWYHQKEKYLTLRDISNYDFSLAFATLFLNRTNRGGIITGGPIGGYKQSSIYSIDCRFNKQTLIKKIKDISKQKNKIELYMLDAKRLISEILLTKDPNQLFIFFDPPYYHQGQALYKNSLTHTDHVELSNSIRLMNQYKWITTYDDCSEIQDIYSDYNLYTYQLRYSINKVRNANEYIFSSPVTQIESFDKVILK